MKVVQKKLIGDRVLLEATASVADVEKGFEWASIAFLQQMGVTPEPGKTPAQVAEERLGVPSLDAIVLPRVAEFLVPFAIEKRGIVPAYPPKPAAQTALKRGSEFTFTMEVLPKPTYELESYDPVDITVDKFSIDPKEVDQQLKQMAESYCEYETAEAKPVAKGDDIKIAIVDTKQNGEPFTAFDTDGRVYPVGQGYMPEGFDAAIIGMNPGESKDVEFKAPGAENEELTVTCTVTVLEQQRKVIPEIDDEWVAKSMPFFRDAKALRESIEYQLERLHRREYDAYVENIAVDQMARRFKGRIDDSIYEAMSQTQMKQLQNEVQQQGMSLEQFIEQNGGQQQFNMMLMMQTRAALVSGYTLDAVYRHEKLSINDQDILDTCALINPDNPQLARQQMEDMGNTFALREMAERRKAAKWIVDRANKTYR